MANIFLVPYPKDVDDDVPVDCYRLEDRFGARVAGSQSGSRTVAGAIADATRLGHDPRVARVRRPDPGQPG